MVDFDYSVHLADIQVVSVHLADIKVVSGHLADIQMVSVHLAEIQVVSVHLADIQVVSVHLADLQVVSVHLADIQMVSVHLAEMQVVREHGARSVYLLGPSTIWYGSSSCLGRRGRNRSHFSLFAGFFWNGTSTKNGANCTLQENSAVWTEDLKKWQWSDNA